jgi:hypothetical protein
VDGRTTQEVSVVSRTKGVWEYDPDRLVVAVPAKDFEIDLTTCRNSAEVLDWLVQVRRKNWASATDLGHLMTLLDELLNFQRNYCPGGQSRQADPRAIITARPSAR